MSGKKRLSQFIVNWDVPLPTHRKLILVAKNVGIKAVKLQTCCGNHGEPGC